ncbi:MAG: imidazole glycerol phosphate synthase subunit HisF [Anaerohalosphaeraceae bacterium]|nr:imidazole glycerol phosphate synthase subunit HisF [Anaerohalosphaeraceae bacterium]
MLTKRIVPCLDVRNRKVTKGVKFQNNVELGDPIEMAVAYSDGGCDELVVYDITASAEGRSIDIDMVKEVAAVIHIPFAVGGGIRGLEDMRRVLLAGAEKVSVNSLAVSEPDIIADGAKQFGSQCIVLGMDPVKVQDLQKFPSGYEITTRGFRNRTGIDALEWAKRAEGLGVGEIVVNSVDADGTKEGFEINLTSMIAKAVGIPVVASGGGGRCEHLVEVFTSGCADAAIIASMIHTGQFTIRQIKDELVSAGIAIRKKW